jgi:hypothetical protein
MRDLLPPERTMVRPLTMLRGAPLQGKATRRTAGRRKSTVEL